jgi:peptidoglycan/LPS O-acetylase OafA/YrhL
MVRRSIEDYSRAVSTTTTVDLAGATTITPVRQRMAWLDALRGVAVLLVLFWHLGGTLLPAVQGFIGDWFFAGYAGVSLFFLVSGYVIPASLERGDLRAFWIGRIFRLYPMYLIAVGLALIIAAAGVNRPDPFITAHPVRGAAAYLSMLPTLLRVPEVLGVAWTLAYEMAFYLLVSGLFALRVHRWSGPVALGFAGAALVVGAGLPVAAPDGSQGKVVFACVAVLALVLIAMLSGRPVPVRAGAVTGGFLALGLLAFNQESVHRWDGLLIPALMFSGTVIYRCHRGQISRWWVVVVPSVVFAVWTVGSVRDLLSAGQGWLRYWPRVPVTIGVVGLLFALGFAARNRRMPRWLTLVGVASYSVYLLHLLLFAVADPLLRAAGRLPLLPRAGCFFVAVAIAVGLAWLTWRLVELPAQRLGKRLSARNAENLHARSQPDGAAPGKADQAPGVLAAGG